MSGTRKALIWEGVVGDPALLSEFSEDIDKLFQGNMSGVKKLRDYHIYRIKLNKKARLLYTTTEINGKPYLLVLEVLRNHEYHRSSILRNSGALSHFLEKNKEELDAQAEALTTNQWQALSDEDAKNHVEKIKSSDHGSISYQPVHYYKQRFIEFNTEQNQAISARFPLIVTGAAGSGKSCVALSLLSSCHTGRAVYVTQSPFLVKEMRKFWQEMTPTRSNPDCQVDFLTYDELMREFDPTLPKKSIGREECLAWLSSQYTKRKNLAKQDQSYAPMVNALKSKREKIYKEFRIICGYDDPASYLSIGQKQSLFNEEDRKWLWELYEAYLTQLSDWKKEKVDFSFYSTAANKRITRLIVDEAQGFALLNLKQLYQLADENCFLMDSHQNLFDYLSKLPYLKTMLGGPLVTIIELPYTHRCFANAAKLANVSIQVEYSVTGGSSDISECSEIKLSDEQKKNPGEIRWVKGKELNAQPLLSLATTYRTQMGITGVAIVIGHEDFREDARKLFDSELVYTAAEIQGLDYPAIIAYRPVDQEIFVEANKVRLERADKANKIIQHRAKNNERNVEFSLAFHELYVTFTRPTKSLIICQSLRHEISEITKPLLECIEECHVPSPSPSMLAQAYQQRELTEQDKQDLLEHAEMLMDRGAIKQANNILAFAQRQPDKSQTKPSPSPAPSPSPPAVTIKKPVAARKQAAFKPLYDLTNEKIRNDLFKRKINKRYKNNSCSFIDLINAGDDSRQYVADMITQDPEWFSHIGFSELFSEYPTEGFDRPLPIVAQLLTDRCFDALLKNFFNKLNDEALRQLIQKLTGTFVYKNNHGDIIKMSLLLFLTTPPCLPILMHLVEHTQFALFLEPKHLTQADGSNKNSTHCTLDSLTESESGCLILAKLHEKNPQLILDIKPEVMFRVREVHYQDSATISRVHTSSFSDILFYNAGTVNFLNDWLATESYIDYIISLYKQSMPGSLSKFTRANIGRFLLYFSGDEQQLFFKLQEREPQFLSLLENQGLFYFDKTLPSVFSMLTARLNYHEKLQQLLDEKPKLAKMIVADDFFSAWTGQYHSAAQSLTFTKPGRALLLTILNNNAAILKRFASLEILTPFFSSLENPREPTTLYHELTKTEEGEKIISFLKVTNPDINPARVEKFKADETLSFLSSEEYQLIERVRQNPDIANLSLLFSRENAINMLFQPSLLEDGKFTRLMLDLLIENSNVPTICAVLSSNPALIQTAIPAGLLNFQMGLESYSLLTILLHEKPYHEFLKLLATHSACFDHLQMEILFERQYAPKGYESLLHYIILHHELHWIFENIVSVPNFFGFLAIYDRFLVDGIKYKKLNCIGLLCRHCPGTVLILTEQMKLKGVPPEDFLFEEALKEVNLSNELRKEINSRVHALAMYPSAHGLLLSIGETNPALYKQLLPITFNIKDANNQTARGNLEQTEDGRKFLAVYDKFRAEQASSVTLGIFSPSPTRGTQANNPKNMGSRANPGC